MALTAALAAAARRGIVVKGAAQLEALARATVVLVDKTGTLTTGRARITRVVPLAGWAARDVIGFAAGAEVRADHPFADAAARTASARASTAFRWKTG